MGLYVSTRRSSRTSTARHRRAPRRASTAVATLLVGILVASWLSVPPPAAAEVFGNPGAAWTATHDGPQRYPNTVTTPDVEIPMSDGTILRGNLTRPADRNGRVVDEELPVVLNMTPYTKMISALASEVVNFPVLVPQLIDLFNAINLRGTALSGYNDLIGALRGGLVQSFATDPQLVKSGYAMLTVDVRGTGFSQGTWQVFGERERQDTLEVIDWVRTQNWADGKVGMAGVSYSGINQMMAAADDPGSLDAIFPVVPSTDLVADTAAPGGGIGFGFITPWLILVNSSKMVPNVASMLNGTFDWKWLADRIEDPLTYADVILEALLTRDVDDFRGQTRELLDADSQRRETFATDAAKITTPTFAVGGWSDLFTTSQARLPQQLTLPTSQRKLIMNDSYHITAGANFGQPGYPPRIDVLARAWYDKWLKGIDNGIDTYAPVTVASFPGGWYVQGDTFPLPGAEHRRMYLTGAASGSTHTPVAGDNSLSPTPPTRPATRVVRPGLSTICSRDGAQSTAGITGIFDFCARDSRISEISAQTFTGKPVGAITRISGPITIRLNQRLQARDGYWHATVNVVKPDGRSFPISRGQLVSSLRAVDEAASERGPNGDLTDTTLALSIKNYQPLRPGQTVALDIPMTPTQARLDPGDRLRVNIYSLNAPKSIPLGPAMWDWQLRPQDIIIDPNEPSWVNIPVTQALP